MSLRNHVVFLTVVLQFFQKCFPVLGLCLCRLDLCRRMFSDLYRCGPLLADQHRGAAQFRQHFRLFEHSGKLFCQIRFCLFGIHVPMKRLGLCKFFCLKNQCALHEHGAHFHFLQKIFFHRIAEHNLV